MLVIKHCWNLATLFVAVSWAVDGDQVELQLFEAVKDGRLKDVEQLFRDNPKMDVNWRNPNTPKTKWWLKNATVLLTAVHYCSALTGPELSNDHVEIFRTLINEGASLEMRDQVMELLPFTLAIRECALPQALNIVDLMIEAGALKLSDPHNTPLMVAAATGKSPIIAKLLDRGVAIDFQSDETGKTALMEAARYNQLDAAKLLLERGASTHIKSNDGNTALDWAEDNDAWDVVSLLKESASLKDGKTTLFIIVGIAGSCIVVVYIVAGFLRFWSNKKQAKSKPASEPIDEPLIENSDKYLIPWSAIELSSICIGHGNFGKVFMGKYHINGEVMRVAVKTVKENPTASEEATLKKEISVMRKITEVCGTHENLIRLIGYTDSPKKAILMDYCQFGNLKDVLQSLRHKSAEQILNLVSQDEGIVADDFYITVDRTRSIQSQQSSSCHMELRNINSVGSDGVENRPLVRILLTYARQICAGMDHLAANSFVHRDLAARNVLVCDYNLVKISDYGLARDVYETGIYSAYGGTLPIRWMAPEALKNQYSTASDVWSFGVVLWELFTLAETPYSDLSNSEILAKLETEGLRLKRPFKNCPYEMYDNVMMKCWQLAVDDRPTFRTLSKVIENIVKKYWIDRSSFDQQCTVSFNESLA